ncbi:MAG: nitronate monooxygenase, partial [Acidimicrobiales bacterium]
MRTPLCDVFGIEYPIFAFTHCRDVVAAVSKAGGLGVLGAVGFSPDQLEIELDWIDEHIDGRPYGVDTVMPQKAAEVHGANPDDLIGQIRSMIDEEHWHYVDELMDRFGLPPLPEGEHPGSEQQRRWRGAGEAGQQQLVEGQPGVLAGRGGPEGHPAQDPGDRQDGQDQAGPARQPAHPADAAHQEVVHVPLGLVFAHPAHRAG